MSDRALSSCPASIRTAVASNDGRSPGFWPERPPMVSRNDRPPRLAVQSREEPIVMSSESRPKHNGRRARLFLNGTEVGVVYVRGHSGSWAFGEFVPSPEFAAFAPVFAN